MIYGVELELARRALVESCLSFDSTLLRFLLVPRESRDFLLCRFKIASTSRALGTRYLYLVVRIYAHQVLKCFSSDNFGKSGQWWD